MRKYRLYFILVAATVIQALLEAKFGLFIQVTLCLAEGARIWLCGWVGARRLDKLQKYSNWLDKVNESKWGTNLKVHRGGPPPDVLVAHLGERTATWQELVHIWTSYK